jgi:hypothetical protein
VRPERIISNKEENIVNLPFKSMVMNVYVIM